MQHLNETYKTINAHILVRPHTKLQNTWIEREMVRCYFSEETTQNFESAFTLLQDEPEQGISIAHEVTREFILVLDV